MKRSYGMYGCLLLLALTIQPPAVSQEFHLLSHRHLRH
jgi:hypothetical protein